MRYTVWEISQDGRYWRVHHNIRPFGVLRYVADWGTQSYMRVEVAAALEAARGE